MKRKVVDGLVNFVKKYEELDEVKTAEIRYAFEGIYLDVTKFILIGTLAILLDIFKEMVTTLLLYNILRTYGFGLHATKTSYCIISSILLFIVGPYIINLLTLAKNIKILVALICIIFLYKNAPADTIKRPLIHEKRRKKYKFLTVSLACLLTVSLFFVKDNFISNAIMYSMVVETLLVSPFVYHLFKLPYANYKTYVAKSCSV